MKTDLMEALTGAAMESSQKQTEYQTRVLELLERIAQALESCVTDEYE